MARKYGIQNGLLSNVISIGRLNNSGTVFTDKEGHTKEAIHAVVDHASRKYGGNLSGETGDYRFKITVEIKETK